MTANAESPLIKDFFAASQRIDHDVLRPLSHITLNWELTWDSSTERYCPENGSFAEDLNVVIDHVATCQQPSDYHSQEDEMALRVVRDLKWAIQKEKGRWVGADYASILEQGSFDDVDQELLISAASGRVRAAIRFGQSHFDNMEEGHRRILAELLSIIIYHRYVQGTCLCRRNNPEC